MNRTATWANIGTSVANSKELDSVLEKAKLDFTVSKQLIKTESGLLIEDKMATIRDDTNQVMGVVGKNYKVCQNRDAFDFVNYIKEDFQFEKAGMTYGGMVYIIGKLDDCQVLGDKFTPYIIFQNGHNGMYSLKTAICPLRIVCQNQFNIAFREAKNTITIKHSVSMESKMNEAKVVLAETRDFMKTLNAKAESLAGIKFTEYGVTQFIDKLFPIKSDATEQQAEVIRQQKQQFINAYNEEDNRNFRGTGWALVNAYTDYLTHRTQVRETKNWLDNQFTAVTFDYKAMEQFMTLLTGSKVF